jgi:5-methylphenazine-1-carboxylate 1-monooxygenase
MIDARTFADEATKCTNDFLPALHAYETLRRPATTKVVLTNRSTPPDFINIKVDELSGGKPFRHIDDIISQAELRAISDSYKQVAGFALTQVK